MPTDHDTRFRVYPRFNDPRLLEGLDLKRRIHTFPQAWFPSDNLPDRLARALAEARVLHLKELLESFEFFYRVRRRLRQKTVVDLCAGHGLTGILFALCERSVTRVVLLDSVRPDTQGKVLEAVAAIAPWVADKVEYQQAPLNHATRLPIGAGVVSVHGCGELSDMAIGAALDCGGPLAIMPCCYGRARAQGLPGLRRALSREVACDVARTYRLHGAGYDVAWTGIPATISPKHRIIVGFKDVSRLDAGEDARETPPLAGLDR